ncbi:MAG: hypothetical protein H7836_02460 [Magnetococcus sp. YQC-3]
MRQIVAGGWSGRSGSFAIAAVATESEALLDCYRQLDREGWWRVMDGDGGNKS